MRCAELADLGSKPLFAKRSFKIGSGPRANLVATGRERSFAANLFNGRIADDAVVRSFFIIVGVRAVLPIRGQFQRPMLYLLSFQLGRTNWLKQCPLAISGHCRLFSQLQLPPTAPEQPCSPASPHGSKSHQYKVLSDQREIGAIPAMASYGYALICEPVNDFEWSYLI